MKMGKSYYSLVYKIKLEAEGIAPSEDC